MAVQSPHSLWVIVLAGGEGSRMCPFVNRCFGHSRPKQYCHFCGPKSMLEITIERALDLTVPECLITVIGKGHRAFLGDATAGRILEQPEARGTGVGIFWPLSCVLREDRDALLLILPSDHYFYPGERLIFQMKRAVSVAMEHPEEVILVGATPDAPETDYGWIEPLRNPASGSVTSRALRVSSFHEKPSEHQASQWLKDGYLWNTMITVAYAKTLWRLGREILPEVVNTLGEFNHGVDCRFDDSRPDDSLSQTYAELPIKDFSRDFLARITEKTLVMALEGVFWSDWGRPERLYESLDRLRQEYPDWAQSRDCSTLQTIWNQWRSVRLVQEERNV